MNTMKNDLTVKRIFPGGDMRDPYSVRVPVFMDEQGFSYDEDEFDLPSHHIVLYNGDKPIATGRIVRQSDTDCLIGRIAVLKDHRGGTGKILISEMLAFASEIGYRNVFVHAQCRAMGFYEKQGFGICGEKYDDEGVPHIPMRYKG